MRETEFKNETWYAEIYEAPRCKVLNMQTEGPILNGSNVVRESTHDSFIEDEYQW